MKINKREAGDGQFKKRIKDIFTRYGALQFAANSDWTFG